MFSTGSIFFQRLVHFQIPVNHVQKSFQGNPLLVSIIQEYTEQGHNERVREKEIEISYMSIFQKIHKA